MGGVLKPGPELWEVVVAQVVKLWHSAWTGWVGSQGQTLAFWFRIVVNLFSMGVRLFPIMCNRTGAYSSFFFPVSYYHLPF